MEFSAPRRGLVSPVGKLYTDLWRISYPFIFLPNFREIILLIVFEVCSVFVRLLSRNIGSDDELKKKKRKKEKKKVAKRFRFNLGCRKTAPLVVRSAGGGRRGLVVRPDPAILQEVK